MAGLAFKECAICAGPAMSNGGMEQAAMTEKEEDHSGEPTACGIGDLSKISTPTTTETEKEED